MDNRVILLAAMLGLVACSNGEDAAGSSNALAPTTSEVTEAELTAAVEPTEFGINEMYALLEAQSDELSTLDLFTDAPGEFVMPQRPHSENEIEAADSGSFREASGSCEPAGMTVLPRWSCTLTINGFDKYGPGDEPAPDGGESTERYIFGVRAGAGDEPAWVVDPLEIEVMFAG